MCNITKINIGFAKYIDGQLVETVREKNSFRTVVPLLQARPVLPYSRMAVSESDRQVGSIVSRACTSPCSTTTQRISNNPYGWKSQSAWGSAGTSHQVQRSELTFLPPSPTQLITPSISTGKLVKLSTANHDDGAGYWAVVILFPVVRHDRNFKRDSLRFLQKLFSFSVIFNLPSAFRVRRRQNMDPV